MVHVHKPEHGSCGACTGAASCPMVYCPTCPTPAICEAAEPTRPESPRPTLGRVVHVLVHPSINNGSDVAPATVTRVWDKAHDGSWLVNLRVFLDGTNHSHEWATSRHLHATEELARKEYADLLERLRDLDEEHVVAVSAHAFWPARA